MLLNVFDRVYVINLPARADRRKEMEEQLLRVGASLDNEKVILFPAVRPADAQGFPSVGARGCFLSHLEILKNIRDSENINYVLILEDDCNFRKNFNDQILNISKIFEKNRNNLFYGGALNSVLAPPADAADELSLLPPETGIMGSHCIGVHRETAGEVAAYFERMIARAPGDPAGGPMHVDGAYSWFRKDHPEIDTWVANPECVYQRSSATDVHVKKWYDEGIVASKIMGKMRKLGNIFRN